MFIITAQLPQLNVKPHIISLRFSILTLYNTLFESIIINYSENQRNSYMSENLCWTLSLLSDDKLEDLYVKQIIRPAFLMSTESKFKFINQIFACEKKDIPKLDVVFNRFEQQKFMDKFNRTESKQSQTPENDKSVNKVRPLFIQFIEQVDEESIPLLQVRGSNPFNTDLVGENAIDAGGPGRELFASLIMKMMNEHIGIFTFNPNRNHGMKETNQEDLIPNKIMKGDVFSYNNNSSLDNDYFVSTRFVYAGATWNCFNSIYL